MVEKHYEEHLGRPFYEGLVNYMTSGPVLASVWEGKNIITRFVFEIKEEVNVFLLLTDKCKAVVVIDPLILFMIA